MFVLVVAIPDPASFRGQAAAGSSSRIRNATTSHCARVITDPASTSVSSHSTGLANEEVPSRGPLGGCYGDQFV